MSPLRWQGLHGAQGAIQADKGLPRLSSSASTFAILLLNATFCTLTQALGVSGPGPACMFP